MLNSTVIRLLFLKVPLMAKSQILNIDITCLTLFCKSPIPTFLKGMQFSQSIFHSLEVVCHICRSLVEPLVTCVHCRVKVHMKCYGVINNLAVSAQDDVWMCDRCVALSKTAEPASSLGCLFCPRLDGALKWATLNPVAQTEEGQNMHFSRDASSYFTNRKFLVHVSCVNLIPELYYTTQAEDPQIQDECSIVNIWGPKNLQKRKKTFCDICKNKEIGFALECDYKANNCGCAFKFHATCASREGILFAMEAMKFAFSGKYEHFFKLYCKKHLSIKLQTQAVKNVLADQEIPSESRLEVESAIRRFVIDSPGQESARPNHPRPTSSKVISKAQFQQNQSPPSGLRQEPPRSRNKIQTSSQLDSKSIKGSERGGGYTRMQLRQNIKKPRLTNGLDNFLYRTSSKNVKERFNDSSLRFSKRHFTSNDEPISVYSSSREDDEQMRHVKQEACHKSTYEQAKKKQKKPVMKQPRPQTREPENIAGKKPELDLSTAVEYDESTNSNPYMGYRKKHLPSNTLFVGMKQSKYGSSDLIIQLPELKSYKWPTQSTHKFDFTITQPGSNDCRFLLYSLFS